jgi:hypothetical protein
MGERKAESASARGSHKLKGLPLASVVGGRAWGVALGVSSVLEGYEDWVRRAAFTVTLDRSVLRSVTYVSKFCKPLDLKQSDYIYQNISYKKKQWRPPSKKKKRGENLSPRNMKACHNVSTALLKSVAEIGTQSAMKSTRKQKDVK